MTNFDRAIIAWQFACVMAFCAHDEWMRYIGFGFLGVHTIFLILEWKKKAR